MWSQQSVANYKATTCSYCIGGGNLVMPHAAGQGHGARGCSSLGQTAMQIVASERKRTEMQANEIVSSHSQEKLSHK